MQEKNFDSFFPKECENAHRPHGTCSQLLSSFLRFAVEVGGLAPLLGLVGGKKKNSRAFPRHALAAKLI
jgi:hypothetical protein